MRLFAYELKKLIGYRVFLFITVACLTMAVFAEISHIHNNDTVPSDYSRLANDITDMTLNEASEYIENQLVLSYTNENIYNQGVLYESKEQLSKISGYENYLSSINEQCSNIAKFSIFADKGSFAYKNALKIQNAYNNVQIRTLPFDVSKGVENVLFSNISDILMLFSIFSAAVFVFTKDKEIGIMNLLFSYPKGRSKLCMSKLSVMLVISLVLEILFTSALLIINGVSYGFGDITRPIQSVNGFIECSYNLNVIQ